MVSSTAMAMDEATLGVTIEDYIEFLPTMGAVTVYDDASNNCTDEIKNVSLEMQPLRKNPIYIKVMHSTQSGGPD